MGSAVERQRTVRVARADNTDAVFEARHAVVLATDTRPTCPRYLDWRKHARGPIGT